MAISVMLSSFLVPPAEERRSIWPPGLGWLLLFFLYACFSVSISEPKVYGLFELSKILRGMVFFVAAGLYVRSERELGILVMALACAVWLGGVVASKQRILEGMYGVTGTSGATN